ncbi:unnamed protein product [Ceutorhynchus assimilis]|uniref:Uncharacterized protein n=1 Tax=Ceutorhynchus assimilis TaxID=467358 RepID=A0A9N9MIX7_9CUCU|nr:unnamed protein product [Ceutorhynchus assimilis]
MEPLQISTLASVTGALLAGFFVFLCICIYAIKAEKCCFSSECLLLVTLKESLKIHSKNMYLSLRPSSKSFEANHTKNSQT